MNCIYVSHQVGEFKDFLVVELLETEDGDTKQKNRHIPVGADVSKEHESIQADAAVLWTQEVIEAYEKTKNVKD